MPPKTAAKKSKCPLIDKGTRSGRTVSSLRKAAEREKEVDPLRDMIPEILELRKAHAASPSKQVALPPEPKTRERPEMTDISERIAIDRDIGGISSSVNIGGDSVNGDAVAELPSDRVWNRPTQPTVNASSPTKLAVENRLESPIKDSQLIFKEAVPESLSFSGVPTSPDGVFSRRVSVGSSISDVMSTLNLSDESEAGQLLGDMNEDVSIAHTGTSRKNYASKGNEKSPSEPGYQGVNPKSQTRTVKATDAAESGPSTDQDRRTIISPTNPRTVLNSAGNHIPNPFFDTLPGPEIWHRRMPPYFPFGETPFMEMRMSRQIEEDLGRSHGRGDDGEEAESFLDQDDSFDRSASGASPSPDTAAVVAESQDYRSPWQLPEVSEREVEKFRNELFDVFDGPLKSDLGGGNRGAADTPDQITKRRRGDSTLMGRGL